MQNTMKSNYVLFSVLLFFLFSCKNENQEKQGELSGKWQWTCCDGKYNGSVILDHNTDLVSGYFIALPRGDTSKIIGHFRNDSLYFKRLHQNYFLTKTGAKQLDGYLQSGNTKQNVSLTR